MIIAVSGKSGSGKSTFAKMVADEFNYKLVDVDIIVLKMYNDENMCKKLFSSFGEIILDENKKVSKKLVGKYVFNNLNLMETLNNLTWEFLEKEIDNQISLYKNVVIDYKFLPITKYHNLSDLNILVEAENDMERLNRIMQRDNVTIEYAKQRENFTPNFNEYNYDFIIKNDFTSNFQNECLKVIQVIKEKAL